MEKVKFFFLILVCLVLATCQDKLEYDNSDFSAEVETKSPSCISTAPADKATSVSIGTTIAVTFCNEMDTDTVTVNTYDTSCSGTLSGSILISSDNFSTCLKMNSVPIVTNSNKTFTVVPSSGLYYNNTYKVRVTSEAKTSSGKSMNFYESSNGFATIYYYVGVGNGGLISSSENIFSWTSQTSGTSNNLNGVTYGNGTWVAVGDTGTIISSTDAENWTARKNTGNNLNDVTFGNNVFVAVGTSGTIFRSTNGTSWSEIDITPSNDLKGIIYGKNLFVFVAESIIYYSSDGTNWTSGQGETGGIKNHIDYGNGIFVVTGGEKILRSSNGILWSDATPSGWTDGDGYFGGQVAYGNNTWLVSPTNGQAFLKSSDGKTWTSVSDKKNPLIKFLNGYFFVQKDSYTYYYSSNGDTWETLENIGLSGTYYDFSN